MPLNKETKLNDILPGFKCLSDIIINFQQILSFLSLKNVFVISRVYDQRWNDYEYNCYF